MNLSKDERAIEDFNLKRTEQRSPLPDDHPLALEIKQVRERQLAAFMAKFSQTVTDFARK